MFRSVKLKDYMLVDPVKIKPDEDIFEAIYEIMHETNPKKYKKLY